MIKLGLFFLFGILDGFDFCFFFWDSCLLVLLKEGYSFLVRWILFFFGFLFWVMLLLLCLYLVDVVILFRRCNGDMVFCLRYGWSFFKFVCFLKFLMRFFLLGIVGFESCCVCFGGMFFGVVGVELDKFCIRVILWFCLVVGEFFGEIGNVVLIFLDLLSLNFLVCVFFDLSFFMLLLLES